LRTESEIRGSFRFRGLHEIGKYCCGRVHQSDRVIDDESDDDDDEVTRMK